MTTLGHLFSKTNRSRHAFAAWLAVFTLLVHAIAPLSMAWASDSSTPVEVQVICTSHGVMTVPLDQRGEPIELADIAKCPLCVAHAAGAVLPNGSSTLGAATGMAKFHFALPASDRHTSLWRAQTHAPRGPPASV